MTTDTTTAPSGAPEAPAADPAVVPSPTDQGPDAAPVAPVSPPGDSPEGSDPGDTQAAKPAAPGEATELRATLAGIFNDPRYQPATAAPAPATDALTEVRKAAWKKYQSVPLEKEEEAFNVLFDTATDFVVHRLKGESQQAALVRTNRERAVQQATELKTAITTQVQRVAPDVDLDLFWDWGARLAQQESQTQRFPDVPAMLDWQVARAIQLVRAKLGTPAVRGTRGRSQPPAQRSRSSSGRSSMVDQVNALREKHLGGG